MIIWDGKGNILRCNIPGSCVCWSSLSQLIFGVCITPGACSCPEETLGLEIVKTQQNTPEEGMELD